MNFNTANQTFRQLLGNGLNYRVPAFQRDYSWGEEEWDDLWRDIWGLFETDGEEAHYMGYLVLQSSDSKRFDIIDGQQRITTLSVMILSALKYLDELANSGFDAKDNLKRKDQLQSGYIGYLDPVSLVSQSKLELNRNNNKFYQEYLTTLDNIPERNINASERLLRKAFFWFLERIKRNYSLAEESGKKITIFIDSLVDKLFFTVITVTDELNAFKVFETLNARGVKLSASDLLKNYLFSLINDEKAPERELQSLENRWERISKNLGDDSFQEFLRIFWNSQNKLVRKGDLFKTIKKSIKDRGGASKLLRDLDNGAPIYAALRDPTDRVWRDEKGALKRLKMFRVQQPFALLIACYVKFYEKDRNGFVDILEAVSILSFRYNIICSLPPYEQESLYNEIARKVSDGTYKKAVEIRRALKDIYPDDKVFEAAFSRKTLKTSDGRNKKVVRYILFEIERDKTNRDLDEESDAYSLEHILPENPAKGWEHIDDSLANRLTYRLGNIALLETAKNRDLGNADYAAKLKTYQTSEFQTTKAIAEHYKEWNEDKVEARQTRLAKAAAHIWKIDF
ncbi:MAG: DUF262 domain-containing HNH endonuclease family protein [Helicobacteraceae bacterium]|nr:DUF262 domain-containing HNH endonuclease family protein [Helicobacteraceae bacterium]